MFKAQVLRRSFSLFRRTPTSEIVKSAARNGHETIRIQRVRIRKRFFTRSRLIGTTVAAVAAYQFFSWLDQELEDEEEPQLVRRVQRPKTDPEGAKDSNEDEGGEPAEGEGEERDAEEVDDDGLLFFPTGFSRRKPQTFYRGSDPEWQEFVRLAPDRQRVDKIRSELVAIVRSLAAKSPVYARRLGKIDPSKGSIWIELRFPDGPPQEYERPGYELTEELNLRKTTRPVDQMHHQRLTHVLVPTAVANSIYYDTKRRVYASWRGLKTYMGWEHTPKPPTAQGALTGVATSSSSTPMSPASTPATHSTSAPPLAPSAAGDAEKQPTASPSQSGHPALERLGFSLPDPTKVPTMDTSYFRMMLRKHSRPIIVQPPRGTFIVSGLVELIGDKAKMTLDVTGVYDPKIAKYVILQVRVRSLQDIRQVPKGGP